MNDLDRYLEKQMLNPDFASEFEKLDPTYEKIRTEITAQFEPEITFEEKADMIGDYFLFKLAEERLLDQEPTISFDEMLSSLGITREDLEHIDVEIE